MGSLAFLAVRAGHWRGGDAYFYLCRIYRQRAHKISEFSGRRKGYPQIFGGGVVFNRPYGEDTS
jgi:hypothetical protein